MKPSVTKVFGSVALGLLGLALVAYFWNPFDAAHGDPVDRFAGKQHFTTPGQGMLPTYAAGTTVLVCFDAFKNRPPRVNDIVVFHVPDTDEIASLKRFAAENPTVQVQVPASEDILYLKRVAAVGGSTIEIRDSVLLVDGQVVKSPFWWAGKDRSPYSTTLAPTKVPPDSFFALGDNLEQSIDSRRFGPVPFKNVVGGLCPQ